MNVKFKMPKFGRDQTGRGWLKELLMTFLGIFPSLSAITWRLSV